jgi:hypothetical protein
MTFYRPSTWDDVYFIVDNMREGDQDECMAGGLTPIDALSLSYEKSIVSYTLHTPDGVPAAMTGVTASPMGRHFGCIWMLGTDDISKHKIYALRRCKPFLSNLYDELEMECFYNYTYSQNMLHHNWLKWLGFTFLRTVALPPQGQDFFEFVRLKG